MNTRKHALLGLVVTAAALHSNASAEMNVCGTNVMKWPGNQVDFQLTTEHFPPGGAFTDALLDVAAAWSDSAAGVDISFHWDDTVTAGHPSVGNHIYWYTQFGGPHALALVTYAPYECTILDVDIWFNASSYMTVSDDQSDLTAYGGDDLPFQAVAMHELGHALGLGHTSAIYSVMGGAHTHLHANDGIAQAYPGEDAVHNVIGAYGAKNGTYEDLALAHWRRTGEIPAPDDENDLYSVHGRTRLFDADGDTLTNLEGIDPIYEVEVGQQVRFELTVENLGKTSQNTVIAYYISTNNNITTQDEFLAEDGKYVTPNEPATVQSPLLSLPDDLDGDTVYWLGAIIDPNQVLAEAGEFNNRTYVKIRTKPLPAELMAAAMYGPVSATAGKTALLTSIVENIGGPFAGSYGYDLYISEDTVITHFDTLLGTYETATFGAHYNVVPLPAGLQAGTYYFGVRIHEEDGGADKWNNAAASAAVTISAGPPDLKAKQVSGPLIAFIGQSVEIQCSIDSVGGPLAGPYTFAIRLTSDPQAEFSDWLVTSVTTSKLGNHILTATIPESLPGPGLYKWALTINTAQGEVVVNDNVITGNRVNVHHGYDMVAQSITGAAQVTAGFKVEVDFQVGSLGLPFAGPWAYDIRIQSGPGALIMPVHTGWSAGTGPQSTSFLMPAWVSPGPYTWSLKVYPLFGEFLLDNNSVAGNTVQVQ